MGLTLSAGVTSISSGSTYFIKNVNSGKYLSADKSGYNGAYITQENFTGASNQRWLVTFNGSYWLFSPQNYTTSTYMNVYGGGTVNGTNLRTWPGTDNSSQWQISNYSTGVFSLRAREDTSKCADVYNGSTSAGTRIILYTYNGTDNQLWEFELFGDDGDSWQDATVLDTSVSTVTEGSFIKLNTMEFYKLGSIGQAYDVDYFKFIPAYTSRYTFYTMGNTDTVGTLYDNYCTNQLASNDDFGSSTNFRITYSGNLIAGQTYYIKVQGYQSTTGDYTLRYKNVYADMNWLYPLADTTNHVKINWAYRDTDSGTVHGGMDIGGSSIYGSTLYAAQNGIVARRGYDYDEERDVGAGYYIGVKTDNRDPYNNDFLEYIYEHMTDYSNYVVNNTITVGYNLGFAGDSGGSSGPHLHFQINTNNCGLSGYRTGGYGNLDENTTNPRKFYDHSIRFYSDESGDLYIYPSSYSGLDYSQW